MLLLLARRQTDAGALASALSVLERAVILAGEDPGCGADQYRAGAGPCPAWADR